MKKLKKITTTIYSNYESMINEFENQESIIKAAIKEIRCSKAKLVNDLRRVENTNLKLINKDKSTKTEIETWKQRATNSYPTNKEIAENCTKKVIQLEKELLNIEASILNNNKSISAITKNKELLDEKLIEIELKLSELKSKETQLNASQYFIGSNNQNTIDEVIDRWEEKLTKDSILMDPLQSQSDDLSDHFSNEEYEEEVQKRLKEIVND